jgi:hypothetical protein
VVRLELRRPWTNRVLDIADASRMARIIYSLQFDLRRRHSEELIELIAPLDRRGQSPHCRAIHPKRRVIDLRPGDRLYHGGQIYAVTAIRAYRENVVHEDQAGASGDGYVVPGSLGRKQS